jgi:hypothetical protein
MGPQRAKKGDKVAVLFGGRMCYVLRPVSRVDGQYEFIGETYMEDFMNGEALTSPLRRAMATKIAIV